MAGVSWVHLPVTGFHSQVSAKAREMPVPSYETPEPGRWVGSLYENFSGQMEEPESARPPPKRSTVLVDFSNTMLCWLRPPGAVPESVRSRKLPSTGSHSQMSS